MTAEEALENVMEGLSSFGSDDILEVADVPKKQGATKGVSFNYPDDSVVRDRKELEDENAHQAGGNAAKTMKKNKSKTAKKNEVMKAWRLQMSHPNVIAVCDCIIEGS
jgi:hypothetical protein